MASSTRDRFHAAIAQSSTTAAAAGLCAAIHRAELTELLTDVWPLIAADDTGAFQDLFAAYLPTVQEFTA